MKRLYICFLTALLCFSAVLQLPAQETDSVNTKELGLSSLLNGIRQQQINDSLERVKLQNEITNLKTQNSAKKEDLKQQLTNFDEENIIRNQQLKIKVDSIKKNTKRYAVAPFNDTLFYIYNKLGSSLAKDRADNVVTRIQNLYEDDFVKVDSFKIENNEISSDIVYKDLIITSVTELDALLEGKSKEEIAKQYLKSIQETINREKEENSISKLLIRIGLIALIFIVFYLLILLINKIKDYSVQRIMTERTQLIKDVKIKNYVLVSSVQKTRILINSINMLRWALIILMAFIMLPIVFSVFPFTQSWANSLIGLFTKPLKKAFLAIWDYIPNLITVFVILFVMRYAVRLVKYIFTEIDKGKLEVNGFHREFAMPTFTIVRFLLQAFTLVLIFPYLPGSNSDIFKGISVFIGVLFSLGSSSAISNIIAGLVITYMRPFRIGDRITIADKTGVVIEKSPLVTRLRTIKNEEITIPNSSILSGNTVNYSTFSDQGICFQVELTVGYEEPWERIHEMLLNIPPRVARVNTTPAPFVLQKKLDDFYVLYELNVYISQSAEIALAQSEIFQLILNDFLAAGIEMNAPHIFAKVDHTPQYKAGIDHI
ncbi:MULTISPECIES: mechanosensitive ion channel family protein [Sphingobacterium]|uniref:Mechanosensitive ion channel domain-containing protein n=1 Tax=Sphingobacterium kitahiroshimense TaxID=470446 RepID=A0ABV0BPI3_9SPHI|nr:MULTISPECIES: mechanosensitive ion channel domain-containing protein [Sphingobacterium]MBB2949373.1 small-conductance mechanosensitive channel [Sphingobacterium sp. JUb56]MCS3554065.1 small-conductance mechanosensitive channel [Sphingobacterium sp. JUb21]MCW2263209.1 small-conductance mechanosensitive channel [Sphingobacterium kitahiroshimense]NJI74114.1 mechanosensitive ion channel [Sphingobacterium sp. B16(2022)]TCR07899.1 mechanosensitive ion channel-like protein [Sphingobacterium sp. JU